MSITVNAKKENIRTPRAGIALISLAGVAFGILDGLLKWSRGRELGRNMQRRDGGVRRTIELAIVVGRSCGAPPVCAVVGVAGASDVSLGGIHLCGWATGRGRRKGAE